MTDTQQPEPTTEVATIDFVATPDAIAEEEWGGNLSEHSTARLEALRTAGRSPLEPKVCALCGGEFMAIPAYPPVCRLVDEVHSKSRRLLWPAPGLWTSGTDTQAAIDRILRAKVIDVVQTGDEHAAVLANIAERRAAGEFDQLNRRGASPEHVALLEREANR